MYVYHKEVVGNQMYLLKEYSNSVALFDEIKTWDYNKNEDAPYWVHLRNIAINDSIIKWAKIFGTDENELHWKKSSDSNGYLDKVRSLILGGFSIRIGRLDSLPSRNDLF